jgi:transcriptional regulator with XRE-family HTH domain
MRLEESFGEVLRAARKQRGLSQEKLALEAEVERNYVSLIELGRSSPSMRVLFKLCRVLEVQPSALLARVEEQIRGGQKKRQSKR